MSDPIKVEETKHLDKTIEIIKNATEDLRARLKAIGVDNLEKLADLRANPETGTDFEMFMVQMHERNTNFNLRDKFQRLEEMDYLTKNPYFARIDLKSQNPDIPEQIYIGKFGYNVDQPVVTDWRASIASIYYRYRFPQKNVEFKTIEGTNKCDLDLKRTFDIDNGNLVKYYNNDIQLDENEIIIEKVKERTGGVLEDIVETIQKDQMEIIEADPRQICIVQGCVGSGKSTVAIHKLAHIFFHFPNYIHPEKSVLIVKNQILIGYLATLFPKLGIFDINFKTLRDLVVNSLFREGLNISVDLDTVDDKQVYGLKEIQNIYQIIDRVHKNYELKINHIFSDPELTSYGGYKYSKEFSVYENLDEISQDITEELDSLKEAIKDNPDSFRTPVYKDNIKLLRRIVTKINDLKLRLKSEVLHDVLKQLNIDINRKLDYSSTLVLVLVYKKLYGFNKTNVFEYCIVDEAQDFSLLEFAVLNSFVLRGRFGLFGDLNQMVNESGVIAWEDIQKVIPEAKNAQVFKLETNYRSTKSIIALANKIMGKYTELYLPKSVNRIGPEPVITNFDSVAPLIKDFAIHLKEDVKDISKTVGIICANEDIQNKAKKIIDDLEFDKTKFVNLDPSTRITYLPKGVYLMSIEECKGLEFSKVYLLGLNLDNINTILDARKAFVGVTRAMNELHVLGLKNV